MSVPLYLIFRSLNVDQLWVLRFTFYLYHQILLTVCFTDANLGYSKEHIGSSGALALGYSITKRTILCSTAGIWFIKIGYNIDPYEISE